MAQHFIGFPRKKYLDNIGKSETESVIVHMSTICCFVILFDTNEVKVILYENMYA